MKTIKIYENYGVLGAEKRSVYTYGGQHARATCSDEMTVEIPDGWEAWENAMGETIVTAPCGWNYEINEVLAGNERPEFMAMDKEMKMHHYKLRILP